MPLRYEFRDIEDRHERLSQSGEGEITQAVVSRMLAIGVQAITAKNLADVVARSRLFDRLFRASFTSFAENGRLIEQPLTLEDFQLRIGLGTNVTAVPAKTWARRMILQNLARRTAEVQRELESGAAATAGSIEFEPVSPDSTSPERFIGLVVLTDPAGKRPPLTVRMTASANQLYLRPEGYGESDDSDGSPAFLDLFDDQLQLVVCRDIRVPEPMRIPLESARETG